MAAIGATDREMAARVADARAGGRVLRFTATVTAGGGQVGLAPIPADSPLARLKYISFETGHYRDQPLLIGGKGAGVEMTAAGVLGDIIALTRERP
jgi:homoserine dehydrogenase